MKRYWKLIMLAVVIVLTIGSFYIKQSLASGNYPEMKLETKSGDKKAADNLILDTNIRALCADCEGTGGGSDVKVTTEGSSSEEETFLGEVKGDLQDSKISRLQKEYRNFMRDKPDDPGLYAEDKNDVVYADFDKNVSRTPHQNYKLNVDWLDGKDDTRSTFAVQLPDHEKYSDTYVQYVYLTNGQLKIVTRNRKHADEAATDIELHVYTIDRDTEEMVDEDTVLTGAENVDSVDWVEMASYADEGGKDGLILTKDEEADSETGDHVELIDRQFVYYDLQTKKQKELSLPDKLRDQTIETFHDNTLYFSKQEDEKVTITAFDINDQKITDSFTVNISDLMASPETGKLMTHIKDEKLYIVSDEQKEKQDTAVIIVDMKSGETVYEGSIALDDAMKNYDVFINGVSFQGEGEG